MPYSTSLEESELRPNRKNDASHTNLALSNLVLPSTRNVYSSSTATSKKHKLKKSNRGNWSSNWKQNITTSGVDHIIERLWRRNFRNSCSTYVQLYKTKKFRVKLKFVLENMRYLVWQTTSWCISMWCNKNFTLSCFLILERLWIQDYWMP